MRSTAVIASVSATARKPCPTDAGLDRVEGVCVGLMGLHHRPACLSQQPKRRLHLSERRSRRLDRPALGLARQAAHHLVDHRQGGVGQLGLEVQHERDQCRPTPRLGQIAQMLHSDPQPLRR
ncbi:MAG: hypothetical protein AAF416_22065 [Pseudomonadota bacterium]